MRIEIAGWFVRDEEGRPVNQSTRDRSPLLFAAAKLMNKMIAPFAQPDHFD